MQWTCRVMWLSDWGMWLLGPLRDWEKLWKVICANFFPLVEKVARTLPTDRRTQIQSKCENEFRHSIENHSRRVFCDYNYFTISSYKITIFSCLYVLSSVLLMLHLSRVSRPSTQRTTLEVLHFFHSNQLEGKLLFHFIVLRHHCAIRRLFFMYQWDCKFGTNGKKTFPFSWPGKFSKFPTEKVP